MNIHGYKQKSKTLTRLIKVEENKKHTCEPKLDRLKKSKRNILRKIKSMRKPKKVFNNNEKKR